MEQWERGKNSGRVSASKESGTDIDVEKHKWNSGTSEIIAEEWEVEDVGNSGTVERSGTVQKNWNKGKVVDSV